MLSTAGVAPRVAQAAMRHSKLDLTMNVCTDPKLLDVARAVNALPALPPAAGRIAPRIAPTPGTPGLNGGNAGNDQAEIGLSGAAEVVVGSAFPVNARGPLT